MAYHRPSVTAVLLGPAVLVAVHRGFGSGTPDQIINDEIRIAHLHGTFPPQGSAHSAAASPAGSADEGPIPRFPRRASLVLCRAASYRARETN
jgi:hypothetical protein